MNILVTGGLGFIGHNFIKYMFDHFDFNLLINIDKESYCSNKNFIINDNKYKYIKADINDKNLICFILKEYNITHIIHFAAQSHVDNSFDNSLDYTIDNVMGTHTLLDCVKNVNKEILFLHFSTDEVYGESIDSSDVKTEISLLLPTNPYSASKASAEMYVNSYKKSYNLKTIILRCNNVFGPNQYPEKVIPKFLKQLKNNEKITIHGKGETIRDFIHIDDVCRAIITVLEKGEIGETYNIGGHNEKTNLQVVEAICALLDELVPNSPYKPHFDLVTYVADRPGHDERYAINADKIDKELGWLPKETFETGLRKTVQWYLSNREWIENITSGEYLQWLEKNYTKR